MKKITLLAVAATISASAFADMNLWDLSTGDFSQDWTNTALISTDDNWSGVASVMGYRGDELVAGTGVDPQTILAPAGLTPGLVVDVNANRTDPNTFGTGGVAEFELTNATVALNGSGTADAPSLNFFVNASGRANVSSGYLLRDLDGSTDNSAQPIALQYRLSSTSDFINVGSAFVADASSGPSLATLTTPVFATNSLWDNQAYLEFRVITANAVGNDEWIGVDDIRIASEAIPEPATMVVLGAAALAAAARRKRK
jgi:hypothetical protein